MNNINKSIELRCILFDKVYNYDEYAHNMKKLNKELEKELTKAIEEERKKIIKERDKVLLTEANLKQVVSFDKKIDTLSRSIIVYIEMWVLYEVYEVLM